MISSNILVGYKWSLKYHCSFVIVVFIVLCTYLILLHIKLQLHGNQFNIEVSSVKMEKYLDIKKLICPICLDIFKEPYVLPCQASCIACYQCISKYFKVTPKQFNGQDDLQIIAKCLCNEDNIIIDKSVPCVSLMKIVKNVTIKCKNNKYGCPFFINNEMEDCLLENHLKLCG